MNLYKRLYTHRHFFPTQNKNSKLPFPKTFVKWTRKTWGRFNVCLQVKIKIIKFANQNLLWKQRNELIFKCHHRSRFKLMQSVTELAWTVIISHMYCYFDSSSFLSHNLPISLLFYLIFWTITTNIVSFSRNYYYCSEDNHYYLWYYLVFIIIPIYDYKLSLIIYNLLVFRFIFI